MGDTKTCGRCGGTKPLVKFHVDRRAKDSRASACKECILSKQREYYAADRQKYIDRASNYYRSLTVDELLAKKSADKKRRLEDKDRQLQLHREWVKNNRETYAEYQRIWQSNNRDHLNEKQRRGASDLKDRYVKFLLCDPNASPHIIEAKREQLRLHRLVVQLQQAIIEVETTEKETP